MVLKTGAAEHEPLSRGPGVSSVLKERHEGWGQGGEWHSAHANRDPKQKSNWHKNGIDRTTLAEKRTFRW